MKASTFLAFVGGAALGAIIALLFAPEEGEKTREKIKSKLKEYGIDLNKEELNELFNRIRQKPAKETVNDAE